MTLLQPTSVHPQKTGNTILEGGGEGAGSPAAPNTPSQLIDDWLALEMEEGRKSIRATLKFTVLLDL